MATPLFVVAAFAFLLATCIVECGGYELEQHANTDVAFWLQPFCRPLIIHAVFSVLGVPGWQRSLINMAMIVFFCM